MNAICHTAMGLGWEPSAPFCFRPPRSLVDRLATLGVVVIARLKARQILDALRGANRKRPQGSGGPGEPPEADPAPYCHWDDAALWILMMH